MYMISASSATPWDVDRCYWLTCVGTAAGLDAVSLQVMVLGDMPKKLFSPYNILQCETYGPGFAIHPCRLGTDTTLTQQNRQTNSTPDTARPIESSLPYKPAAAGSLKPTAAKIVLTSHANISAPRPPLALQL